MAPVAGHKKASAGGS